MNSSSILLENSLLSDCEQVSTASQHCLLLFVKTNGRANPIYIFFNNDCCS
jgi:hypothetical protein